MDDKQLESESLAELKTEYVFWKTLLATESKSVMCLTGQSSRLTNFWRCRVARLSIWNFR